MILNEIRRDYLLDHWVIIAHERAKRPTDFSGEWLKKTENKTCVFCPGNERMTPPASLLYLYSDGSIKKEKDLNGERAKNWLVRSVPNLYPALTPRKPVQLTKDELHERMDGVGTHEVIIESPNHNEHPGVARIQQLELLVQAYIDKLKDLSKWGYVSIFRNHGKESGASRSHAHSQIIATPILPKQIADESVACINRFEKKGVCPYCEIIESENKSPRFIYENKNFVSFTPWASVYPFEFWLFPKRHQSTMLQLREEEIEDLALSLRICLGGLAKILRDPPYSYGFHIAPIGEKYECFHWHLEVYPKLSIQAGFEKSTGMFINATPPEIAAESLRNSIEYIKKHMSFSVSSTGELL